MSSQIDQMDQQRHTYQRQTYCEQGLKEERKKSDITEDDLTFAEKEVQKLTDDYIKKIDAHLAHKEEEIMKV